MKLTFRSADGSLTVEAEPKTIKDAFEAVGQVNEFLISEPCGCCKSVNTFPRAKHSGDYVFYEWCCRACGAAISFGQAKEGGRLFLKRNDKNKNPLPDKGWSVYKAQSNGNATNGSWGSDGYQDPPSRQASAPAGAAHTNDDDIPWAFWIGIVGAGLSMMGMA
jgi:hypothetical protein